jgi:hypothetical protein
LLLLLITDLSIKLTLCLRSFQIQFDNRKVRDVGNDCLLSVDGTDFQIAMGYSKPFWSYKFKKSGLWFEVGLCILTGDICWWSGPYAPGKWNDLSIFRDSLQLMLEPEELCETDRGYQGSAPTHVKCPGVLWADPNTGDRQRAVQELGDFENPIPSQQFLVPLFLVPLSFSPSSLLWPTLCFQ